MLRRRRVIVLLSAALLIGGGVLVVSSVGRIGPAVVKLLERQIHGQLTVRSWTVQFRPSPVLIAHGVEMSGTPTLSWESLFRARRVELHFHVFRLLLGQLRITRIGLDSPELNLEALAGRWSVEPEARPPREGPPGESGSLPARLIISDPLPFEIRHGRLTLPWGGGTRILTGVSGRLDYSQGGRRLEYRLAWSSGASGRMEINGLVIPMGRDAFELQARVKSSGDEVVGEASLALELQGPFGAPILSGRVSGKGQVAVLPGTWVSLQGSGSGRATVEGSREARHLKGSLTVEDGRIELAGQPPIESLRGRIVWTSEGADFLAVNGRWESLPLRARLNARWRSRPPTLRGELFVSAIDLTPLLGRIAEALQDRPATSSRPAPLVPSAQAAPAKTAKPAWAREMGVDLRLRAASAHLNGERLGSIQAQLLAAAGLWHLQGIRLTLDEGDLRGYIRLDVRSERPRGTLFAQGPGLALLREGLPEPYRIAGGSLRFETLLRWEGLSWREFRESVRGQGELQIRDGRLATAQLIRHVEIRGIPPSGWEAKPFLAFDELWTRYRVAGPQVVAQALAVVGPAWEVRGEGTLHFSGHLDFRLTGHSPQFQQLTGLLQGDLTHPRLVISY